MSGWWKRLWPTKAAPAAQAPGRPADERLYAYVEFDPADAVALERLRLVLAALDEAKRGDEETDDRDWRALFLPEDHKGFWNPSEKEAAAYNRFWQKTEVDFRLSPAMPTPPWDFLSMIEAILTGEYDLVGLEEYSDGWRLNYDPHAYPYGGVASLVTLVKAFGHRILGFDDGTGYQAGDFPERPRWRYPPDE